MTQCEAKPSASFLYPPWHIEFTVEQRVRKFIRVKAEIRSGNYTVVRKWVDCQPDRFGEIPPLVINAIMQWTLWWLTTELERREDRNHTFNVHRVHMPDWPNLDGERVQDAIENTEQLYHGLGDGSPVEVPSGDRRSEVEPF